MDDYIKVEKIGEGKLLFKCGLNGLDEAVRAISPFQLLSQTMQLRMCLSESETIKFASLN